MCIRDSLYPGIKFGIGPAIENGFYSDVDSPTPITEADLPKIEQKMQELSRNKEQLVRREVPKAEALKTFTEKEMCIRDRQNITDRRSAKKHFNCIRPIADSE